MKCENCGAKNTGVWCSNCTDVNHDKTPHPVSAENFIHGKNMVEEFGLSHEAIKAAKYTAWGSTTEMQVFAIGIEHGMQIERCKQKKQTHPPVSDELTELRRQNEIMGEALMRMCGMLPTPMMEDDEVPMYCHLVAKVALSKCGKGGRV